MRKREATFLGVVIAFAVVFIAMTLTSLPHAGTSGVAPERAGVGEARDVDTPKFERLVREHYLSNREAEFYHRLEPNSVTLEPQLTAPKSDSTGARMR